MTVVRSLLVKIGFVTNKQTQNQVNKTIASTKKNLQATSNTAQNTVKNVSKAQKSLLLLGRRMLLGWVSALFAVKKFFSYFNNVAIRTIDSDILARSIGLARESLQALNSEAQNFGFKENQFSSLLSNIEKMNRDVRNGVTSFHRLNNELKVNIDPKGSALGTLRTILEGVKQLDTENSRREFLENLFPGFGVQLSDLSQDLDNFYARVNEANIRNVKSGINTETLKEYTKAINEFSASFERFTQQLTSTLLPVLTKTLDVFNALFRFREYIVELDRKVLANAKSLLPSFETIQRYSQPVLDTFKNGILNASEYFLPTPSFGQNSTPVSVTLNNTIQVPVGTTQDQASSIIGNMESQINSAINRVFINIQNNNPQVE